MLKHLLIILIILLSSCSAKKYITLNGWSRHMDRSYDWNERQNINGIEIEINERYNIEASTVINSFGDDSWALNLNRIYPIEGAAAGGTTGTEFLFMKYGIADGYGTGVFPFFMPGVGKNFDHLRVELVVLPSVLILFVKVPI